MHFNKKYQNLILLICSTLITLVFAEIAIRAIGRHDLDGNFYLFKIHLKPHKYPVVSVESDIQKYLSTVSSFIMYDADLGWAPRPKSESRNGLYKYNADGIRTASGDTVISKKPQPGVLRIALFGDSFTHGDEVAFNETWGFFLEDYLKKSGVQAEVLNFGVCGYGMDQAYLRWKKTGREFMPHLVIFGFQPENVQRNLNIIRAIYCPNDEIFFSKPRFIIEKGKLKLLNVPSIEPGKIPVILGDLKSWDLINHEYWMLPENYQERFWHKSKLISLLESALFKARTRNNRFTEFTDADKEPGRLAIEIVKKFKQDTEASGAKFIVLYLMQTPTVARLMAKELPTEVELLGRLDETAEVIHPEKEMVEHIVKSPWRTAAFHHYSSDENEVLGKKVASSILESIGL